GDRLWRGSTRGDRARADEAPRGDRARLAGRAGRAGTERRADAPRRVRDRRRGVAGGPHRGRVGVGRGDRERGRYGGGGARRGRAARRGRCLAWRRRPNGGRGDGNPATQAVPGGPGRMTGGAGEPGRGPRIVVVGSTMVDLVAFADRLPEPGETLVGTRFLQGFGGKGANQAVMAARFGARVSLVAAVGADPNGAAIVANLRSQDVGVDDVATVDTTSGVAPIWV